jgi:Uma2 family endonuclease
MIEIKTDPITNEIIYPTSDGKRMAENTKQYRYLTTIQGGLDALFAEREDVFVAGDLLWYPEEGKPNIVTAPDVMVVFGRPKGDRGAYLQWKEDNTPPQVVFEILSPSNTPSEMNKKLAFYNRYGVREYYIYDPDNGDFYGFLRDENGLRIIEENMQGFKSPLLGITFELEGKELKVYHPDGKPFLSFVENIQQFMSEYQLRREEEKKRIEEENKRIEAEKEIERLQALLRNSGIKF